MKSLGKANRLSKAGSGRHTLNLRLVMTIVAIIALAASLFGQSSGSKLKGESSKEAKLESKLSLMAERALRK
jgi:hypothetical protein